MTRLRRRLVAAVFGGVLVLGPIAVGSNVTSAAANAQGTAGYEVSVPTTDLTAPTGQEEGLDDGAVLDPVKQKLSQLLQAFADYLAQ